MFSNYKIDWRFVSYGLFTFLLTTTTVWSIGFWLTYFLQTPNENRGLFAATLATAEAIVSSPFYTMLVLWLIVSPWYWRKVARELIQACEPKGCK